MRRKKEMFKRASSMTKRAQRQGKVSCETISSFKLSLTHVAKGTKMLFRIQVHKVTFPPGTVIPADAEGTIGLLDIGGVSLILLSRFSI